MAARPSGPLQPRQPGMGAQHAPPPTFQPTAMDQAKGMAMSQGVNMAANHLFPTAAAAPAAAAAAPLAATAASTAAAAAPAATGIMGSLGAAGTGLMGSLGGAGAGLMAAAAPIAMPLAIGAGLGKLFGLFNEGGRVPAETMTAMQPQQAPQPQAPQQQPPLSFKALEQQQSLALKKQAHDGAERRKDEAHQIKMMQQQLKLTEAAGLRTPLSAP